MSDTGSSTNGTGDGAAREPSAEELKAHIEETRDHLAETVDALSAKADVKARAKDAVTTDDGSPDPKVVAVATAVAALVVALVVLRRRRAS